MSKYQIWQKIQCRKSIKIIKRFIEHKVSNWSKDSLNRKYQNRQKIQCGKSIKIIKRFNAEKASKLLKDS